MATQVNFSVCLQCLHTLGRDCGKSKTDQHKVIQRNDITFEMSHAAPCSSCGNKSHDLFSNPSKGCKK